MVVPGTRGEFMRTPLWRRVWLGVRPSALRRARRADVDADVEASIRNYAQISRTLLYALLFTIALTTLNSGVLAHRLDLQATWSAFALAMSQVGAFFALRRSNETRAYLGDVRLALHELTARTVLTSAVVYPRELRACTTTEAIRERASDILRHLMDSRLFPRGVAAFSVWARDDRRGVWRMVAAVGASATSIEAFTQPILATPTDGAGVIANLAITADQGSSYYQATAAKPPRNWFKPDPAGGHAETVAAFLLPDENGSPIGAFALTSPRVNALEVDDDGLPERLGLIIEQCTVTLVGVARVAHALWSHEEHHVELE